MRSRDVFLVCFLPKKPTINRKYQRLRAEDRKVIENLGQAGSKQTEIGLAIGFSQSTISKELARNRGERGYFRRQTDEMAVARLKQKKSRLRIIIGEFPEQVEARLRIKHSPDQISQSLRKVGVRVCDGDGCKVDGDGCEVSSISGSEYISGLLVCGYD